MSFETFLSLFEDLHRLGPSTDEATRRALSFCTELPPQPAIADLGCGTGSSALILAEATGGTVQAVDCHPQFFPLLHERAAKRGLSGQIQTLTANFVDLDLAPNSIDLIWSEGAIACVGLVKGLSAWIPLLKPGGYIALTDAVWFTASPPPEPAAAWGRWYPDMFEESAAGRAIEELGFQLVAQFRLETKSWFDYLEPVLTRCHEWSALPYPPLGIEELTRNFEGELDLIRRYGDSYGYTFFVMRKR